MKIFAVAALLATCTAPGLAAHHELITAADAARLVDAADRLEADRALDGSRMPARAIDFMQIEPGDRILEMLAGGGYYAELLARAVGPEGFVLAQNPSAFAERDTIQAALSARSYGDRIENAAAMDVDFMQITLAPNSIDGVLFHLTYHDLYFESADLGLPRSEPQTVLANLHNALRSGGTITVIDHVGENDDARAEVAAAHRIDPDIVKRDFEQAGFTLVADESFFDNPDDDRTKSVFDPSIRGKTDRFAMRFAKAGDPNSGETFAMADAPEFGAGDCDAGPVEAMIGQAFNDANRAAMLKASGAKTVRVYSTGDAVTMDYRTDRLNVELEPNSDTIAAVSCG